MKPNIIAKCTYEHEQIHTRTRTHRHRCKVLKYFNMKHTKGEKKSVAARMNHSTIIKCIIVCIVWMRVQRCSVDMVCNVFNAICDHFFFGLEFSILGKNHMSNLAANLKRFYTASHVLLLRETVAYLANTHLVTVFA